MNDLRNLGPRSPKRRRSSPDRDSPDSFDRHYNIEGDDDYDEQPAPKKTRHTSRGNPTAEVRRDLLHELRYRRLSKESRRTSTKPKSKVKKLPQLRKKSRSLPVDELLIVSERFESSDTDAASSSKFPIIISNLRRL